MPWTQNSLGEWEHSGTVREGLRFAAPDRQKWQIEYRFAKIADEPSIAVFPSEDARTCWEVGIFGDAGASTSNISIRQRTNNTPAATTFASAHNVPANTPFTILVSYNGVAFSVTISTTGVAPVTIGTQAPGSLATNTGHAFFSAVNGAKVISGGYRYADEAFPVVNSPLVGFATGNGGIYVREVSDNAWRLLRSGCFGEDDEISAVEYGGKCLAVAYDPNARTSRKWKIDVAAGTVTEWTAQYGAIPADIRLVETNFERVYAASETSLYTTAAPSYVNPGDNPEDDWLYDPAEPGSAQVYNIGNSGRQGEPILALWSITSQAVAVFKKGSVYTFSGDPVLGQPFVQTLDLFAGISGPNAIAPIGAGEAMIHTPEGAYVLTLSGATPLSKDKLRRYMDIGRNQRGAYTISVEYDPRDALVYFFLTQNSPSPAVPRLHPVYDVQTGEFLLDEYPQDFEPTAACWWERQLVLGGRDGYCRRLQPFGDNDDGQAFESRYTLPILETPGTSNATHLTAIGLQLGTEAKFRLDTQSNANGVVAQVFSGQTAEDAILSNRRTARTPPMMFMPGKQTHYMSVADHALVVEIKGMGSGFDWFIEEAEVVAGPTRIGYSGRTVTTPAIPGLCRPVFIGGTPTPNVPPVANAGPDVTLADVGNAGGVTVRLDGSLSTDSDGVIVSYLWTDASGATVATTMIADVFVEVGTTTFTLTVTDDDGATDTDTKVIVVNPFDPGGTGGPTTGPVGGGSSDLPAPGGDLENPW